ncbi:G3E family GTPase [Clostridiales Family XIII bacterium PM5-7]
MTKVDIFSGFLGAGKTTLIKKLIEEAYTGEKIVLIENEFGEIGIDGGFLKDAGVEINEMNSGCICCSLVGDFAKALEQVIEQFNPDRILIEPSGVGKLSDVILAVENIEDERIVLNGFTTIVDAKKCKMYMKNFGEFYNNQIEHASSIILSHTTGLSQEKLDACVALVREHNQAAALVTTPWEQITGMQILETIEQKATLAAELQHLEEETHHHDHHDHDHHEHHEHSHDCGCGHDHHDHDHGHHHADDVFTSFGVETTHKFTEKQIEEVLTQLQNFAEYGQVLRAKGIVEGQNGQWIHFDYVPGEPDVRAGSAAATGMICVIGADIEEDSIKTLFGI